MRFDRVLASVRRSAIGRGAPLSDPRPAGQTRRVATARGRGSFPNPDPLGTPFKPWLLLSHFVF